MAETSATTAVEAEVKEPISEPAVDQEKKEMSKNY